MKELLKNILIIGTGGTIAGTGAPGLTCNYEPGKLKLNNLIDKIPEIKSLANINYIDMFDIDSCDMSFEKISQISKYINNNIDKYDGFVVTHGTDTLEETAYFLNLVIKTEKPVVLTGAMRPSTSLSNDGCLNLYQAVALASNEESRSKGVLIAFGDSIYSARDVQKTSTYKTNAFNQKDLGCLGFIRDNKIYFYNISNKIHTVNTEFDINNIQKFPKIEIAYFYMNSDTKILKFIAQNSDGIIISCAGCGTVSTDWFEEIENLVFEKNKIIVFSSKINNGLVNINKKFENNIICSNNLSTEKSRILLTLALTKTRDINKIQEFFDKY